MNKILVVVFIFGFIGLKAQKSMTWKQLGGAEKTWLLLHPFSAAKARDLTNIAIHKTDSVQKVLEFSSSKSGDHLDALRHAYWMALISNEIGPKRAAWMGKAHEKKGKKDFEKAKLEDGSMADRATMEMDLFNNEFGVKVGKFCFECSYEKLLQIVLEALQKGELKIIKQNKKGQSLDENGVVIPVERWKGKWENERVLQPSNLGL